jgi:hypothetical protein
MQFDNNQTAIKIQMQKQIIAIFSGVLIALVIFIVEFWTFLYELTGLPKLVIIFFFLLFFLVFYAYHLLAASSFISFSDDEGKIVLRFYQLNAFNTAKMSFEIPKSDLTGYKIEYKFKKLRQDLIIYRRYQGSIVKYPSVPISALTDSERTKLISTLNKYVPRNI